MTPGAAQTVLTNGPAAGGQPGIYYNVPAGTRVLMRMFCFGIITVSDDCYFELGYTTGANGTGTFVPITKQFYIRTGAAPEGRASFDRILTPPPCIKYSSGARSITVRVDANDANAQINVGWNGWYETDT